MASSTVFVSNFPFATTEDELRERFEELGEVRSVRIIVDRETGRSRGFAFVELVDADAMDSVIEALDNSEFRGRRLAVSQARGRAGAGEGRPGRVAPRGRADRGNAAGPRPSGAPPLRHRIVVDWVEEESAYAASIPELGVAARATTPDGAVRDAWLRAQRATALRSGADHEPEMD